MNTLFAAEAQPIRDGDRIVLIGDTLIEREQESGWLETMMAAAFPQAHVTVRNLGWSADTPAGASRGSFDFADPAKGYLALTNQIAKARPTLVILGYGMASSFDGQAGLGRFTSDFNRLLDSIQSNATNPVRFILFSPLRHENKPAHNAQLKLYTDALRAIAGERNCPFVDLFDWHPPGRLSEVAEDGIHLTPDGYRLMAGEVARQLGWPNSWRRAPRRTLEELRDTIVRKDQLFFDRWRPENQTYLLGFRSYEQGKNARELPEFDPLVAADEREIVRLQDLVREGRKPPHFAATNTPAPAPTGPVAMPQFIVAPGFEVSLWAETPLLAKPTQINFDPKGRLWVAESSIYPQIAPGQKPNDKIVVLEDRRHTGHADTSTVFANGLFIPTGVEPGDGGCYVGQSTELLHFTGKLGGKVQRQVVLSGFGTEDTHHMVHTLNWGPDGRLYFDQSIYIHSYIETANGVVRLNSGGVLDFRPRSDELEVFLRGFCNPWGHQFDAFGQSFVTDGAGGQGISWGISGATYFTYAEMRRELPSISPGSYPKFCGLEIIATPQFPEDWQGSMVTADFRAHRLVRFAVEEDGAGYVTKEMPDLLRTTNETFRPIDLKLGPDGALYVADWCNPIINHGEVDFRDPRRDHNHGRIWRIAALGRPTAPRHDWTRASNRALLEALVSSNAFDVRFARRVLAERGHSILPALKRWEERQTSEPALLAALWTYQSINVVNNPLLDRLLAARDGRVRAAAVRVLSAWPRAGSDGPDDCYRRALSDPFPRVRVEALRAVAKIPSLQSATWALDTWQPHMDPFLNYALWLTINDLAKPWLDGVASGQWHSSRRDDQLRFAFDAIDPALGTPVLDKLLQTRPLTRSGEGPWIQLIGHSGGPAEVQRLWDKITSDGFDEAARMRAWTALTEAAARGVKPDRSTGKLEPFFNARNRRIAAMAIALAGKWKPGDRTVTDLLALATAPATPAALRKAGFEALRQIGGPRTISGLTPLAAKGTPPEIRSQALVVLTALDPAGSAARDVQALEEPASEKESLGQWRSFLRVAGEGPVLAAALPLHGFPLAAGKAGLRAIREAGGEQPELLVALTRAAGLQGHETELTKRELMHLSEAVLNTGDPARGERLFRSPEQSCTSCHSIGGVGGHVGPDLTSIGASAPLDYLIDSVYYPNKEIKDGFASVQVETKDGTDVSGILVRENDHELVLRPASGPDVTVSKADIVRRKLGGSLMPSGLTDNLTHQQQLDLFRFLSELGKPGPYDASKANVARAWKVGGDDGQWRPVASLVNGDLQASDIRAAAKGKTARAETQFRSVKTGPVHFVFTGPASANVLIDGQPVAHHSPMAANLASGTHSIEVQLDAASLPAFIRLESDDGAFLSAE